MIEETLSQTIMAIVYGVAYGIYGIITKKPEDEKVDPKKLARSIVVFVGAALVVQSQGGELNYASLNAATGQVAALGVAFDMAVSRLQR
jgi:hypothetical protein